MEETMTNAEAKVKEQSGAFFFVFSTSWSYLNYLF